MTPHKPVDPDKPVDPGRRKGGEDTMYDQGLTLQRPCSHLQAAATDAQVAMLLFVPRAARSVATVRHHVRDLICRRGLQHVADDVELLTSELATNAVEHADGFRYAVAVSVCPGLIVVEVFDSAPQRPVLHERDNERECGRGLTTVAALAKDWGTAHCPHGKRVWFTVQAWPGKHLLIPWFLGRVPGGAPVLTWGYDSCGWCREGRFVAMFASTSAAPVIDAVTCL